MDVVWNVCAVVELWGHDAIFKDVVADVEWILESTQGLQAHANCELAAECISERMRFDGKRSRLLQLASYCRTPVLHTDDERCPVNFRPINHCGGVRKDTKPCVEFLACWGAEISRITFRGVRACKLTRVYRDDHDTIAIDHCQICELAVADRAIGTLRTGEFFDEHFVVSRHSCIRLRRVLHDLCVYMAE